MSLLKNTVKIGVSTIISRILGLVKEAVQAQLLGAGPIMDAISVALKIPSLVRKIFAEGAFHVTFLPQFSQRQTHNESDAFAWAEEIFSGLLISVCCVVLLLEIFMDNIVSVMCPTIDAARKLLIIDFARFFMPIVIFLFVNTFFSALLNAKNKFTAASIGPAICNCFIISTMYILYVFRFSPSTCSISGIIVGTFVQAIWTTISSLKSRMIMIKKPSLYTIKTFSRTMVPGIIGSGVSQINLAVDLMLASSLPAGYISYMHFSDRLGQVPLSVIGTAISIAVLPSLSRLFKEKDYIAITQTQWQALIYSINMAIPSAAILYIFAKPIIYFAFEWGKFTSIATSQTASALKAYSIGIPAYILIKVLGISFFANGDTSINMKLGCFSIVSNVILCLLLMPHYLHVGIVIATTINAWASVGILIYLLRRDNIFIVERKYLYDVYKSLLKNLCIVMFLIAARYFIIIDNLDRSAYTSWIKILCVLSISLVLFVLFHGKLNAFNNKKL